MARIGKKAAAELGAEALLISNSFPVPRATPERTVEASRRVRALYLYRRAGLASRDKASNPGTVRPFAGRQPRTSWR